MLLLGILSRLSAFGLLVFTIVATVLGHAFWTFADSAQIYQHLGQFLKDLGLVGGLLLIVVAGGGALSIDGMFRRS
jgi:putative oxidoreductase